MVETHKSQGRKATPDGSNETGAYIEYNSGQSNSGSFTNTHHLNDSDYDIDKDKLQNGEGNQKRSEKKNET
jgi:hypothetical protein